MSPKYLEYYLDEFDFLFNRKISTHRGKLFYRFIQQAVTTLPVTYNEMIDSNSVDKIFTIFYISPK